MPNDTPENGKDPQQAVNRLPIKPNADQGREPQLITGRMGTRLYSIEALIERIITTFEQEHANNSPALVAAITKADKLKLLRDTINYVIAVESIILSPEEQAAITRRAYAELFTYGALDAFFADPKVTTITIEGGEKLAVRYGHADLETQPPSFDDHHHARRVLMRLMKDAGAAVQPDYPYLEFGLTIEGRPVCVNLVLPPITPFITADIRVHPAQLPSLDSLVESEQARQLLTAIAQSPYGFIVVGEPESGKTTLLSILAGMAGLSGQTGMVSVERAGELRLPDDTTRYVVKWGKDDQPTLSFGTQIAAALNHSPTPSCILLDEVRADEPQTILPLLVNEQVPRQMWAFRGPADSKRLAAALGMVARRGNPGQGEALVQRLYRRLPFVIVTRRRKHRLQLHSISEWQFKAESDYPDYVELIAQGWDGIELTGKHPQQDLKLPQDFWR